MVRNVMSGKSRRFCIVAPTAALRHEYATWFFLRGKPEPIAATDIVLVRQMDDNHDGFGPILAGCSIFPTDGPFAVCEYAATNPSVSTRLAYEAMDFGIGGLIAYGVMRGKGMICFPSSDGMEKMLARRGFARGRAWMECSPWKL